MKAAGPPTIYPTQERPMNVSPSPTAPPTVLPTHDLSGLLRAVEGDNVEHALLAAKQLVRRDARVTIPRLVTHLEERFAALLELGPTARTREGKTACIALAIALEPLLWRTSDGSWQQRLSDLSNRGMFNPTNL